MTPRTHRRLIVAVFAYVTVLLGIPSPARAEDIDIFMKNPLTTTKPPNVLIILDTSANWAATDTVADNGSKMYENVRAELAKTIEGLTPNLFRVGLMIYAETGTGNDSIDGGVMRLGVRDLIGDDKLGGNQTKLVNFFKTIDANYDKTNNTSMGLAFYEAYLYYSGIEPYAGIGKIKRDFLETVADPVPPTLPVTYDHAVGITGNQQNDNPTLVESLALWRTTPNALSDSKSEKYNSPISDACQKNFIIYIANGTVTDPNSANVEATTKLAKAIDAEGSGSTTTIDLSSPDDENESNITDEWARFLAKVGVQSHPTESTNFPTNQKVVTYSVEVNAQTDTQGRRNTKLLRSVGEQGQGGYYGVCTNTSSDKCTSTEKKSLSETLNSIFNQIIDRNSVFAAATLPASSNVRGTFLNQVYMGVFRPNPNASPRWPGNVKQYKIVTDLVTGNQYLGDKLGERIAAEFSEEGFVRPDVTSIWTVNESPGFWDPVYYPDTKSASNPTASDAPDGAFVEKGGAAQHLRMAYATDVTTRKLFTCVACTDNTTLSGGTYPSANAFDISNTAITAALLGITGQKTVSLLTRVAGTVTATSTNHGFSNGQSVEIKGATQSAYNVTRSISVIDNDTFTYSIDEQPVTPGTAAGGQTLTASSGGLTQGLVAPPLGLTRAGTGTTVTATTPIAHGFSTGDSVIISGADDGAYNSTFTITGVPTSTTFTFTVATTPATPPTSLSGAQARVNGATTKGISTLVRTTTDPGTTVTVTTSGNIFTGASPGSGTVEITGVIPTDYEGTFTYAKVSNSSFTYTLSSTGPAVGDTGFAQVAPAATKAIASITRGAGNASGIATVTVTTSSAHTFSDGNTITISGAAQPEYNGSFKIADSNQLAGTFTYTISTSPASPATTSSSITATGGGGVDRDSLINWVRGTNVRNDDNPVQETTRVRGYLHGDVLHSRPVVINYNRSGEILNRDIAVFYGANDGIVHAVKGGADDGDGYELWGFVPSEFFDRFARLYNENPIIASITPRNYFADGPITANTIYNDDATDPKIQRLDGLGASKAQIFVGMRRGGRFYYSLGVTDPTVPVFKWKIANSTSGFAELGQSWSEARVATINVQFPAADPAASRRVLVFGAGYDAAANDPVTQGTATMGRGIFVVDADTGALIWSASPDAVTPPAGAVHLQVPGMDFAIPATLAVIDSDGDVGGFADRIYAPDTGGNIWRVNIGDTDPSRWTVRKVAALSGGAADQKRKFLFAPSVVNMDDTWDSILVGSGDREQPFNSTIKDRFYMIKDAHALNDTSLPIVTDSSDADVTNVDLSNAASTLVDLTSNVLQDPNNTDYLVTQRTLAAARGWKIRMTRSGEKVVTSATTLAGTTFFGTSTLPEPSTPGQCSASLGKAYVYAVSFKDATAVVDLNGDGVITSADTSTAVGLGFPASPTAVVDEQGRESVIVPPGVFKPSAISVGQRYRVFWNLSIDN